MEGRGERENGKEKEEEVKKEEEKKEEVKKVGVHRLLAFADAADGLLMAVGAVAAVANGVSQPLMTVIFGQVIDAFGGGDANSVLHRVNKVVLNFVYLAIGSMVASFFQVACWMVTGERQAARIRGLYLKAILRQDIAFFDKEMTTGQVVERMSGDTILIQDAIGEKVGKFIQLVATFLGGFIIAFTKGWLLSLVMLSSIPPVVIAGATMSWFVSKMTSRGQATYSEAGNVVEQTIGSIRTVASFNGEKKAIALYNKFIRTAYLSAVQEGTASGLGMGTVFLVLFCSYALAMWYGSRLIINKGYTGGMVINVLFAVMTGAMSLGQATPCVTAFAEGQAAAYRMFETIKRKPEIDAYNTSGIVLEDMKGDVELQDVYFSYPTRPDYLIFNGFSLKVSSGTTMAIVGESGSGKSTVINLVERFYDPQAGEVLIDGVNIKSLRLSWIREKIGLVSQEPLLFTTTIKENITYGKTNATLEEIKRATELANAANFIDKLPNGLDTMVGERGAQLSGGQKQRIAIARAILKDPKILLLDEATSALDVESERVVQEALNRVMLERTTIVVAHRLSTVRNADAISVVHQGKIVEQGCHDELIRNPDGAYSQLIHLQETHKETKEHVGDSAMRSLSHESKSLSKSKRSISFKRSASRGSSIGSSSRRSFTIPFGLTGPMEVEAGPQDEAEDKEVAGDDEAPKEVPITRLISLNKPEIPVLLVGSIAAAIHGVLFPMFGILLSISIKIFFEKPDQQRKDSNFWSLMYVVLGIVALFTIPIEYFLFGVAGGRLIERIRSMSFQRIVHQEITWFDEPRNSSGAIGARLSVDAANVRRLLGDTLALMVQCLSTLLTGFIVAMVASWRLALIITVVIPLVGFQGYAQIKFMKGYSADAKVMYEEASQVANDAVSGIRTVASFSAEQRVLETYNKKCEAPVKQGVRQGLISGSGFGFSFLTLYLTYALCFYVGARFVHDGKATFSDVFRVFFALVLATMGISQTSALGADSAKAKESTASIFGIIDRKSKVDSSSEEGVVLANVKGDIEFQHVAFKYPSRPNIPIFTDFSLTIHSGKTVALVGESGSGKSTVISLLERFYDPDSGKILFDGVEIETLRVSWLRQQMGLVSQEPVLFNDTIRANIAYGKEGEATEEDIIRVAKAANAHQFVSALPDGYDTPVGERGIQLSGGQKQRIAIARAILKDPRVLLLDEATSALDAESEHVVQEALDRVMVGRTTVVVAHRLSTIKGADMIAVLKNGMIVEKGKHEKLMGLKDGVYASLVELRMSSG
ncbi:ABC transporter B family member 4-like isoform X1 [Ananas comosus]|uniref:ABC transporter B family member 4-like isoform X1 n=1 Tax=Ananas comosus TaxID=4615 RepID=A0A6P5FQA1_ANACO|nr:ABC transporter B family member 4-like isoform X1 [Ananas comosus]